MLDDKTTNIIIGVSAAIIIIGFCVKIFLNYKKYKKLKENTIFPPWPSTCPDYWKVVEEDKCQNINKIGLCRTGDEDDMMDFSDARYKGGKGPSYKCAWSKACKAPWEGVDSIC